MNNEFDEELEELEELENYDSNSFNNNKNLKKEFLKNQIKTKTDQIRQQRNNVNHNQNATNRLKQRNANTLGKKVESRNSTSSNNEGNNLEKNDNNENKNTKLNPLDKLKQTGKNATKKATDATKDAAKKAGKAVAKGITTGIKALALNPATAPFFWVGVLLVILIILIPILWAAYDSSSDDSGDQNGVCNYILNGEEISNLKVRLLECGGNTPIAGEEIIDFDKYVLGVTYAENEGAPAEGIKAEAIAAKSYALRRPDKMGFAVGLRITDENGQKILNIRNCTNDQVYCDPDKGCWTNSSTAGGTVHSGYDPSKAWKKPPLAQDSEIRQAVEEIKDKVLITSDNNIYYATYTNVQQTRWNEGARQGKNYQQMLKETYPDAQISTLKCTTTDGTGSCNATLPVTIPDGSEIPVSSPYGPRWGSFHRGVDIPVGEGTEIYSVFDGTVTHSGWYGTGGLAVIVAHDLDGDGATDYNSRYYHMSNPVAKVGDKVTGGQLIGYSGNTGASTGPHLHFGLESTSTGYEDPLPTLKAIRTKTSIFNNAKVCEKAKRESTNFVPNNKGSSSNGAANSCNGSRKDTSQPDPAIAINYWNNKGVLNKNDYIYPKDSSGYNLGAHPKNFKYENISNMRNYNGIFAWPVTPENGIYKFVYEHYGIDIMAPFGTPVYAPVSGQLVYSEWGHTQNQNCNETAYSVKIKLDKPFNYNGYSINYIYMTHMMGIVSHCSQSSCNRRINQGEIIGFVGWANATHLHVTFCVDSGCGSNSPKTSTIEKIYSISSGTKREVGG